MNGNNPHIDERLLMQFLLGELATEQMQHVLAWMKKSPENQKQLDELEMIWAETGKLTPKPVAIDKKQAWEKLSARIDGFEKKETEKLISLNSKQTIRFIAAIAAVLLISFGVFQLVTYNIETGTIKTLASNDSIVKKVLPDGSTIALNLNSQITYPERFSKNERVIQLKGEVFFKVTHNPKQPFIVSAGNAKIKVLGTSFQIKSYTDHDLQVSVLSGKVQLYSIDSISGDTSSVFITPGKTGTLLKGSSKPQLVVKEPSADEFFWMDSTLVFLQMPLYKVTEVLEKYYKVSIQLQNPGVGECRYSGTFSNNTIDEILQLIADSFAMEISHENQLYLLKGNGCLE